ncbi:2-hydroxyacyl-CoA dehydratase [Peptoniphilus harei]
MAENGREQIDKYLDQGKKVVGVFPYYAPEEIIYAGGLVPFGVWGGQGPIDKAKEYFPTFYYSLALRCLEMGLDGSLDGLSASMITTLDDTLRPFSQNYKVSVGREIPMVFLNHAQHRKKNLVRHTMLKSSNKLLKDLKKSVTLR